MCTHTESRERVNLDRQSAVSVLKEILVDCGSFSSVKAEAIAYNSDNDSWELNISWVPHQSETECLEKIVTKYALEMVTSNERTVFRSKSKI